MKKILFILMVAFAFTSCDSDDDSNDSNVSAEGMYELTFFGGTTPVDFNQDGTASANQIVETGCYQDDTITLTAGGTGSIFNSTFAFIDVVIDTEDENNSTFEVTCIEDNTSTSLTWTQNEDQVSVTTDGVTFTGTLSGDELSFVLPKGNEVEVIDGDVIVTLIEDLTLTFTKQ